MEFSRSKVDTTTMNRIALEQLRLTDAYVWQSGLRFAFAALLAFAFYHFFDLQFGYWAVVTVAAVMQKDIPATLKKSHLRLLGTLIGALIAYVMVSGLARWPQLLLVAVFLGLFVSSLLVFAKAEWMYGGIVCGITFIFTLCAYHLDHRQLYPVIVYRTIDVCMGLLVAWGSFHLVFPKHLPKPTCKQAPSAVQWRLKAAFIMTCAATLSLWPWFHWHYSGGFWAPIACLFIVEESFDKTTEKAIARFFAHVVVICVAGVLAFCVTNVYGLAAALAIGMFVFGMIQAKPIWGFEGGIANTMAIAFSVVLLLTPTPVGVYSEMLARLLNTSFGILVGLMVVKIIQHSLPSLCLGFTKKS